MAKNIRKTSKREEEMTVEELNALAIAQAFKAAGLKKGNKRHEAILAYLTPDPKTNAVKKAK